jgi:glucosamine kinase
MNTDLFLIGIDGGGSGTRIVLGDAQGRELAQAASGPSGLGLGVERAWQAIQAGCREAFSRAGVAPDWSRCVLGCGLAGVHNRDWLAAFRAQAPRLAGLAVESDAYTTLLGAHGGAPGVVVALGTGSVAAVLDSAGECHIASGFGFPSGDEASGAWLGLRVIVHAQQALDGRVPLDALAQALLERTGAQDCDSLVVWLCAANQTAYASLAPIVFAHRGHPFAARLLNDAGVEIGKMIAALDPSAALPVALCGGLGAPLREYVPQRYQARLREPLADSAHGALHLAQQEAGRLGAQAAG